MKKYVMFPFEDKGSLSITVDKMVHEAYDCYCSGHKTLKELVERLMDLQLTEESAASLFKEEEGKSEA